MFPERILIILLAAFATFFTFSSACWGKDDLSPELKEVLREIVICSYQQGYENYADGNTCKQAIALMIDVACEGEGFSRQQLKEINELRNLFIELSEICFKMGAIDRIAGKNNLQELLNNADKLQENKPF